MAIKIRRGLDADRLSVVFEEGEVLYTTDTKSFFIGDGVTAGGNQIGGTTAAELLKTQVHNATGSTLTAGQVVYLSGNTGNKPNAVLAKADAESTSSKTIGLIISNIANNANGYIATDGLLEGLNTSMFIAGDMLWLSDSVAGGVTTIMPDTPNHAVFIGYVTYAHPSNGAILIHIQNGYELNELHDVKITSPSDKDGMIFDSALGYWKNSNEVTVQGNTFNAANKLVQLDGTAKLPAVDGSQLTNLAWGNISGKPTTLSGYGITDAVPSNRQLTINGTTYDLSADRSWTISTATPTLAQVTTAGNTTTNSITVGGLTVSADVTINGIKFGIGGGNSTYNVAIGLNALVANTGLANTAVGYYALNANTIGESIVAIGTQSLKVNTTGGYHVSIGQNALLRNTTGTRNLAIGYQSLSYNTTGIDNIAIGSNAGLVVTTGQNNIYIGNNSNGLSSSENNRTWIGNSGTATTWLGGNVLIGTTTDAGYKLDVNGSTRVKGAGSTSSTNSFVVQNSAGSTFLTITDDGVFKWGANNNNFWLNSGTQFWNANGTTLYFQPSTLGFRFYNVQTGIFGYNGNTTSQSYFKLIADTFVLGINSTIDNSAQVQFDSTTKGFLPPRMTTTQKNAISSPAAGLVVYDTILGKLCVRGASAWETITSI